MNYFGKFSRLAVLVAVLILSSLGACKTKEKIVDKKVVVVDQYSNQRAKLNALLDVNSTLSLDEKEKQLKEIKDQNITDPGILDLIKQLETKLANDRQELNVKMEKERLRLEEERRLQAENMPIENKLLKTFSDLTDPSKAGAADQTIASALSLFASPETPVLIIVYKNGETVDYDEPTTAQKYLSHLKDVKKFDRKINNIVKDENGKIKELELIYK